MKTQLNRTAREAVEAFDRGEILRTVEMGGLAALEEWGHTELHEVNREQDLGLSGAQVGAIRSLAFRALRDGWDAMVDSAPEDRRIQFSNNWPGKR